MRLIVEKWILSELYAKPVHDGSNNEEKIVQINGDEKIIEYELKELEKKVETLYNHQNKDFKHDNHVSFIIKIFSF